MNYTVKHGRATYHRTSEADAFELARGLVKDSTCCAVIQDHKGRVIETLDPDPLPEHFEHDGPDEDSFSTYGNLTGESNEALS